MTGQDTLVERYGAPSPVRRRVVIAASALLGLAFLGWLAWAIWVHSTPKVTSDLESYRIVDDHTATAVLDVELRGDDVRASCTVQALATDHSVVGERTITAPSSAGRSQKQDVRIATDRRATSVQSVGCTAPGQSHPR